MNRTVKLKGTNLFSKERWDVVRKAVSRVNMVTMKASMLGKAYYLSQEETIPVDEDFYDICIKVLTDTALQFRGEMTPEKQAKQDMYSSMRAVFLQDFGSFVDLDGLSISQVLGYEAKQLETAALNNIQFNFPKYLNLFMYKALEGTDKKLIAAARNHILYETECPVQLSAWVQENRAILVPQRDQDFEDDILQRPWVYLRHMVQIVRHVETNFPGTKVLSPLVFRRSYIPKHIHLDTNGLVQLLMKKEDIEEFASCYELEFGEKPKLKTKADLGKSFQQVFGRAPSSQREDFLYQQAFWAYLCKFDHQAYKRAISGELSFGNSISTDGCSVSLLLVEKQAKKKFSGRKVKKKKKKDEFEHEVKPDTLFLGCDPGKSDLIAITDGSHTFKYTRGQREQDCQRKRYERRSQKERERLVLKGEFQSKSAILPGYYPMIEDPTLLKYEQEVLSMSSSRSCDLQIFLKYVRAKLLMEDKIAKLYSAPRFRNDRFTRYVLTKSSEDRMLNRMKEFVSKRQEQKTNWCHDRIVQENVDKKDYKHVSIFYGDWGRSPNLKNQAPTPGVGLRRKIDRVFDTISIPEHFTSKTCPCCKQRTLENPKLDGPKRTVEFKHHLLRCTSCGSWWNRNWAGAYNILLRGLLKIQAGLATA